MMGNMKIVGIVIFMILVAFVLLISKHNGTMYNNIVAWVDYNGMVVYDKSSDKQFRYIFKSKKGDPLNPPVVLYTHNNLFYWSCDDSSLRIITQKGESKWVDIPQNIPSDLLRIDAASYFISSLAYYDGSIVLNVASYTDNGWSPKGVLVVDRRGNAKVMANVTEANYNINSEYLALLTMDGDITDISGNLLFGKQHISIRIGDLWDCANGIVVYCDGKVLRANSGRHHWAHVQYNRVDAISIQPEIKEIWIAYSNPFPMHSAIYAYDYNGKRLGRRVITDNYFPIQTPICTSKSAVDNIQKYRPYFSNTLQK